MEFTSSVISSEDQFNIRRINTSQSAALFANVFNMSKILLFISLKHCCGISERSIPEDAVAFVKEDNAEVFFCGSLKYSDSNERVFFFFVYRDKNGNSNTVKVRKTFAASVWELLVLYYDSY